MPSSLVFEKVEFFFRGWMGSSHGHDSKETYIDDIQSWCGAQRRMTIEFKLIGVSSTMIELIEKSETCNHFDTQTTQLSF